MLFVCLSHFAGTYLFQTGAEDVGAQLAVVGMIASPTFVAVSGLVAGFLSVTDPRGYTHVRRKLLDRGVFLLLIGHAVLAVTDLPDGGGALHAYRIGFITDAIAVAVMIGPWLVVKLTPRARLLLATAVFLATWLVVVAWHPGTTGTTLFKHYVIGITDPDDKGLPFPVYPVLPWASLYLAATLLGERVGGRYLANDRPGANWLLIRVGLISLGCAMFVRLLTLLTKREAPVLITNYPNLATFLSAYQKFPPGPVYIAFFGGAGMLLVAGVLELERRAMLKIFIDQLREMGQASLFVYVGQFYLYAVLLRELHLPYTRWWPLLFIVSVIPLARGAAAWNKREGNRFLTVGITSILERRARRKREQTKQFAAQKTAQATVHSD